MNNKKELLFSVTAADCIFKFQVGRGNGGQNKQKTNSACHCKHPPSGAQGYAEDSRSQHDNKKLAFKRMAETKQFQSWLKLEISRRTGELQNIEEAVEKQMNPVYIKTEIKKENKWTEADETELE